MYIFYQTTGMPGLVRLSSKPKLRIMNRGYKMLTNYKTFRRSPGNLTLSSLESTPKFRLSGSLGEIFFHPDISCTRKRRFLLQSSFMCQEEVMIWLM